MCALCLSVSYVFMSHVCRLEDNFIELVLVYVMWFPGIELRCSGLKNLQGKPLYSLSHFSIFNSYVTVFTVFS